MSQARGMTEVTGFGAQPPRTLHEKKSLALAEAFGFKGDNILAARIITSSPTVSASLASSRGSARSPTISASSVPSRTPPGSPTTSTSSASSPTKQSSSSTRSVSSLFDDVLPARPAFQPAGALASLGAALGLSSGNLLAKRGSSTTSDGDSVEGNISGLGGSPAPPGLGNWDNSCYQNSMLQGLASLRTLPGYLERVVDLFPNALGTTAIGAMRELLSMLNDITNAGRTLWTPEKLKSMSSWQQQDAQEYFSKIIEELDKEILKAANEDGKKKMRGLGNVLDDYAEKNGGLKKNGFLGRLPELLSRDLRNPLEGLLAQRVGCTACGYSEGLSLIPFNCLTVPLGRRELSYDVRECLDEYTKLEFIDGVECPKCTLLRTEGQLLRMLAKVGGASGLSSNSADFQLSDSLRTTITARLVAIQNALEEEDFSDATLVKKCNIPKKNRVTSTKSRQAVVARAPDALVLHINRSVFDEFTGAQLKNTNGVYFQTSLDLGPWVLGCKKPAEMANCGGQNKVEGEFEAWIMDPSESMVPIDDDAVDKKFWPYRLRAVVSHFGRHENGHYICYRQFGSEGNWWQLSDDDVYKVSEQTVLNQRGVFMLFYERVEMPSSTKSTLDDMDKTPIPARSPTQVNAPYFTNGHLPEQGMLPPPVMPTIELAMAEPPLPNEFSYHPDDFPPEDDFSLKFRGPIEDLSSLPPLPPSRSPSPTSSCEYKSSEDRTCSSTPPTSIPTSRETTRSNSPLPVFHSVSEHKMDVPSELSPHSSSTLLSVRTPEQSSVPRSSNDLDGSHFRHGQAQEPSHIEQPQPQAQPSPTSPPMMRTAGPGPADAVGKRRKNDKSETGRIRMVAAT
ncbi:hypothetical protein BDY21DRAFT_358561 [Lineolata rhizophorae]|uniref:ubiquitinyl hydrolase 1 n=1 Tax=Lineolata rhizophorae TaxID=578093 RepID=A0A6A6NLK0_9PEZI|nr:hypothetical protein BDY21DRAFT_358561 [Lineolata rhizophorae]